MFEVWQSRSSEAGWWRVSSKCVCLRDSTKSASTGRVSNVIYEGTQLQGVQEGDWLKVTEPGNTGYIRVQRNGVQYLSRVVEDGRASPELRQMQDTTSSTGTLLHQVFDTSSSSTNTLNRGSSSTSSSEEKVGRAGPKTTPAVLVAMGSAEAMDVERRVAPKDMPQECLDENGNLWSVGSAEHASLNCKPCIYFASAIGCHHGVECRFCHIADHANDNRKRRVRPGKGKRDFYKILVKKTLAAIELSPESSDPASVKLPPTVEANQRVKETFMTRMKEKASSVVDTSATQPSASSSSSAPRENIMSL